MLKFYAAFLLILATCTVQAQTWEIGGALGTAGYIGDLNSNPFKPSGESAGIFVKRNFNGYLGVKLSYQYYKIAGADSTSAYRQIKNRNLSFTDGLKELSLRAELHFMKFIPDVTKSRYTPYIYLGVGFAGVVPHTIYNGEEISLRNLRTEGQTSTYALNTVVIPYGAGIKYNFTGKWTIGAELGYRYTFTDYLDDVSGVYASPGLLPNPLSVALADRTGERTNVYTGTPGSQRGDLRSKDIYGFFGITLSYTFVTAKCYYE